MRGYEERIVRDLRRQVADRDATIAKLERDVESWMRIDKLNQDINDRVTDELLELREFAQTRRALDDTQLRTITGGSQ